MGGVTSTSVLWVLWVAVSVSVLVLVVVSVLVLGFLVLFCINAAAAWRFCIVFFVWNIAILFLGFWGCRRSLVCRYAVAVAVLCCDSHPAFRHHDSSLDSRHDYRKSISRKKSKKSKKSTQ
ncbi:hypothetical protein BZA77DRAFT_307949 [Pyronema omphalodes]|nr:hypothetical protein BZA77DRAFT_307949 [Pyronema omphalodes]